MTYRLPARYRVPARYRHAYRRRRNGDAGKVAGLAAGTALAIAAAGTGTAAAVHHKAASRPSRAAVAVAVTSGSETAFIAAVLADLGAPGNAANVASLESWFPHEYPSWPPWAANNPMSSTLVMPGATVYNTLAGGGHVWNYPTASEGAQATALTLEDGWYPNIVSSLRSGAGLCGDPSLAGEFLTWSGGGYSEVC